MKHNEKINGVTRVKTTGYISRPAWNETHTVERTAIRHAKIEHRKNIRETIFWAIVDMILVTMALFAPMVNYVI